MFSTKAQVLSTSTTSICRGDSVVFTISDISDTDTVVIYSATNVSRYDTIVSSTCTFTPDTTTIYTVVSINDSTVFAPPVLIQVHNIPTISLYHVRVACNEFTIHYDLINATLPVQYYWSNGVANTSNTIHGGDTTIIYLSDYNGCTVTDTISIPLDTLVTIDSIWSNPETCILGTAGIQASGGVISYTWDDSSHAQVRELCQGTYHVVAINQNGCSVDTSIVVNKIEDLVAIVPYFSQISYYGGSTEVSIVPIHGTAPYSYLWSNGATDSIQQLQAGSYYCVVIDANGCSDTVELNITQPTNLFVTVDVPTLHCSDQNALITPTVSGGIPPYTYTWNGVSVIPPINVSVSGNYSLVVTDANGYSQTTSVSVQFPTPITASISASATEITAGTPVILSASLADEYIWSTGETTQSITVYPSTTCDYWLFVRNNSGCSDWANITITVTGGDNPGGGDTGGTTGNQLSFNLGSLQNVCWNSDPIVLQNYVTVNPFNGGQVNFVGPGVAGGVFYPSSVGMAGTYEIIASYYDPLLNTQSSATQSITVHPSTTLDWTLPQSTVGLYDAPIHLAGGVPTGGFYSGVGVVQQGGEYFFYPSSAGIGTHMLFYEYNNDYGCYSNTSKTINVVYSTSIEDYDQGISVYPNPVENTLTLELMDSYDTQLFDMLGKRLYSFGQLSGTNELEVSSLSKGIYILQCTSESGVFVKKIVKK